MKEEIKNLETSLNILQKRNRKLLRHLPKMYWKQKFQCYKK